MARLRSSTTGAPAGSCRPTTRMRWPMRWWKPPATPANAHGAGRPPTRMPVPVTRGPRWRAVWRTSTTTSAMAGRRPPAPIPCSRPNEHDRLPHPPLRPSAACPHPRGRRGGGGRRAAPLPAARRRAVRQAEAAVDRADAAANGRDGRRAAAAQARARRGGALPRRAPAAGRTGGAGPPAPARGRGRRRARAAAGRAGALVSPPGPGRGGAAAATRHGPRRQALHRPADPRPAHPLGQLLLLRCDELQLASAARAGRGARLCGGARGGPPRDPGPLAPVLAARELTLPGLGAVGGLAPATRARPAPVAG